MLRLLAFEITNPVLKGPIGTQSGSITLQTFIGNFVTIALGVGGIIAFFMLVWGGIEYITAGGDKEATQKSVKRITNALIGLSLLLSVFAIIFVVETLFGIPIKTFTIPIIQ